MNIVHGGNLDEIERIFGIPKDKIKDFSGNINPIGAPESVKTSIIQNIDCITKYPDVDYLSLRTSISNYTGVSHENIMVGNGSTELIGAFIKTINPQKAVIVSPAYSEYEREITNIGGEVSFFPLLEENDFKLDVQKLLTSLDDDTQLLVICNPNNPTGTAVNEKEMEEIVARCKQKNIFVMVDETYAEFTEENEKITATGLIKKHDNLFVVRGTSKFFAVPGLRLGYAMCANSEIMSRVNKKKDLWSVSSLSAIAGAAMFSDTEFIKHTKKFISAERIRLIKKLNSFNALNAYESKANFILIKIKSSKTTSSYIFSELIKQGLLIRDVSSFPFLDNSFIRICILSKENNDLLIEALRAVL